MTGFGLKQTRLFSVFLKTSLFLWIVLSLTVHHAYSQQEGHITSVTLHNQTSGTVKTFAHPFRRGDIPQNSSIIAQIDGKPVEMQVDVKARWDDRSVKHAILSVQSPNRDQTSQVDLFRTDNTSIKVQSLASASLMEALRDNHFDLVLELEMPRETHRLNVNDWLALSLATNGLDYWLKGDLVEEARLINQITPDMLAILDLRVDQTGSIRASFGLHNDLLYENNNETFTYNARFYLGGSLILEKQNLRHYPNTNWREVIWSGASPSAAEVSFDPAYLVATHLVPPYDVTLRLTSDAVNPWSSPPDSSAFEPFSRNDVHPAMPDTGYRPDLGMLPVWSVVALISQDVNALRRVQANGSAAGGIPWHFRDPKTDRPVKLSDRPRVWLDYRATVADNGHVAPSFESLHGWKIDSAHMPDLNYFPYLLTGDRYFLDELQFQVNWAQFHSTDPNNRKPGGLWANDQVRAQGWQLRSMTYAAQITPDIDPMKEHFETTLKDRLSWYVQNHIVLGDYGAPKGSEISGWVHGYSVDKPGLMKPFMQDFFAMPISYAALLGYEDAQKYARYMANFYAGRFTQNSFDPIHANTYSWSVVDDQERKLKTWKDVADINFSKGLFKKETVVLDGYAHLADAAAGSTRGGLGLMTGVVDDPLPAEAYAYVVSQTPDMDGRSTKGKTFSQAPQWSIVPIFPDGSVLPIEASQIGNDSGNQMEAGSQNALLMGLGGNDRLKGGAANTILIGWDGNDRIETGSGYAKISGGRGNDTVIVTAGTSHIRLGAGNDVVDLSGKTRWVVTLYDYNPSEDVIKLPKSRYDQDGVNGWLWKKNQSGQYELIFSDDSRLIMNGLSDADLSNIRIDIY